MTGGDLAKLLLEEELKFTDNVDYKRVQVWSQTNEGGIDDVQLTISWELNFEMRRWGIKEGTATILAIKGHILFEDGEHVEINWHVSQHADAPPSTEDTKDYLLHQDRWTVEVKQGSVAMVISDVDINVTGRKIEVEFSPMDQR